LVEVNKKYTDVIGGSLGGVSLRGFEGKDRGKLYLRTDSTINGV